MVAAFGVVACLALITAPLRATYESFRGTTLAAASMVRVPGAVVEPEGGRVLVPIVDSRPVSVWGAVRGWLDEEADVARAQAETWEERDIGVRHMERAARVAAALAARQMGAAGVVDRARLETHGFGGPSAGLPFALELVDQLSAGDLTRGLDVAATGELTEAGEVVAVGGARHKAIAAERAGVDLFFVPPANFAEVNEVEHSFRLVAVASISDALEVLCCL